MEKVYIKDESGNKVLPITHVSAVRDDDGNSLASIITSKTAASGGTELSLVTTGEKYTWNNKSNLTIGTTDTTAAAGNHTHASNGITAMTGYSKASSFSAITTSDTLNQAIGKLEKKIESDDEATAAALTDLDSSKADLVHTHSISDISGIQVLSGTMTTIQYNDGDGNPRYCSYVSMSVEDARKVISFQYMVTNQGGGFNGNQGCTFYSGNDWGYANESYISGTLTLTRCWFHLWGAGDPGTVYYNIIKRT